MCRHRQGAEPMTTSIALEQANVGLGISDRLYTVTAFCLGLADDLTPYDYLP